MTQKINIKNHVIHAGARYKHNNVVVIVDSVDPYEVYFSRWRSGSDGSDQSDYEHFLDASRCSVDDFKQAINKIFGANNE